MAIVTITRGLHSGGEEIAENVAKALGARCVSGEVLRETAKAFNVPETKISQVFDKSPNFWERMTESRRIYLAYIQATLAEWAKEDDLVYHGNAGQELLREVPHVLRVRLMFPVEHRVQRIMEQFSNTREQAERMVAQMDEDRTRRTRYLFAADWRDPRRYDITIHLERITAAEAEQTILILARQPEFQLDDARRGAFKDFLLKCRVYAVMANLLVGRLSLINVVVADGVVTLQGTLTSQEAVIEQLAGEIEKMEGVRQVNNEIVVGLVYHEWNV